MLQNIYIVDDSAEDAVAAFLVKELGKLKGSSSSSGKLWSFIERSRSSSYNSTNLCLRILSRSAYSTKSHKLRSPELLDSLSTSVALACLYGASRCLAELLKAWVEERKGRKIRIIDGEKEITIEGGVSKKQLEEVIRTFESRFGESEVENKQ